MPNELHALSESIADIVERFRDHLVTVAGRGGRAATGLVWSEDGLILTADHALERDEDINIGLPDGRVVPATLVGRDPSTDLALLRVDAVLKRPTFVDAAGARPGQLVLALGRPRGGVGAALGLLRAVGGGWRTGGGGAIDRLLDVDGSLPRGYSGGALVDATGRVLGLNTAGLVRGGTTVPSATLQRVAASLVAHGRMQRAYLGLSAVPVGLPASLEKLAGQAEALLVVSVEPDGPADRAGVGLGDVLLSLEGQRLARVPDLLAQLGGERVGQTVALKLLRAGAPLDLSATLGARAVGCG